MKKKRGSKVLVNILSVLFILFVLLELQIMFNYPDQFIWFVGIGALILVDVYFLVSMFVNQKNAVQADKDEQFENISKSEKASYLLVKKCFQDLDERMSRLEEQLEPIEAAIAENEVRVQKGLNQSVTDNKKMAKILLGKNKEHTEALINSNDEMQRILKGFEQKLSDMESRMVQFHPSTGGGGMSAEQYQEIMASIQSLGTAFQKQVDQVYVDGQAVDSPIPVSELEFVEDVESMEGDPDLMSEMELQEEKKPFSRPEPETPKSEPEPMSALQSLWKMQQEEKRAREVAEEPEAEQEVIQGEIQDEIPEAYQDETQEAIPELAEPSGLEPELGELFETGLEPEESEISELGPEPEELFETPLEPGVEDLSEPGLLPEPEVAAEPEIILPEPEIEDGPPAPDLGDPNKLMSPEEIAALIANM